MGVFGSSDGDESKRLESDIAFIKTRLDLIARQLSGTGSADLSGSMNPDLDTKLHAIFRSVESLKHHVENQPKTSATNASTSEIQPLAEEIRGLRTDVENLLQRSDRVLHLDLSHRLDGIDTRLEKQQAIIVDLTDALRSLIAELGKR